MKIDKTFTLTENEYNEYSELVPISTSNIRCKLVSKKRVDNQWNTTIIVPYHSLKNINITEEEYSIVFDGITYLKIDIEEVNQRFYTLFLKERVNATTREN